MRAIFLPKPTGLELLGSLAGDLLPLADGVNAVGRIFTGASLAAIRAAHGIAPSVAGLRASAASAAMALPSTLTRAQLLVQLLADERIANADAEAVEATIRAAIPVELEVDGVPLQEATIIRFRCSTEFRHAHPQVRQFAGIMGYDTQEKYDALFVNGAKR